MELKGMGFGRKAKGGWHGALGRKEGRQEIADKRGAGLNKEEPQKNVGGEIVSGARAGNEKRWYTGRASKDKEAKEGEVGRQEYVSGI